MCIASSERVHAVPSRARWVREPGDIVERIMERGKIKNDLLNADFADVQSETLSYLFAEMATKDDLRELRSDMQNEFRAVRQEMHSEFRAVRQEMHSEFRAVRGEMQSMKSELLAAIDRSAANLRTEIAESSAGLHKEIAGVHKEIAGVHEGIADTMKTIADFKNKLFMMTLGLIGALATVFTGIELLLG